MKLIFNPIDFLKWLITLTLIGLLAACGTGGDDDIDQFIKGTTQNLHSHASLIPQAQPYLPIPYNADNTLNDPFKPRQLDMKKGGGVHPNLQRPKGPLEAYALDSLKFVGLISKAALEYALIKTPDNTVQQVKLGSFIGPNFGMVTAIREDGITLKEIVWTSPTFIDVS